MAKKKITEIVSEVLSGFLAENNLELYNVEFVKEGKDRFLRVFIDKQGEGEEEYISTDDCETVSRFLSDKLDELDPIEQNYYLEVSSPGLDRALLKPSDYIRYLGRPVDISLFKSIDGRKKFSGILTGYNDEIITITLEQGSIVEIPPELVSKTRLAVIV